jgi:type II secretory pathway pseudopilin PulG
MDARRVQDACDPEAGYMLLAVIFLTLVLMISLAMAVPKIAMSIQRDRDLETIHRGEQYKRAIKLYYKNFGSYPTTIDQLVQTNNMRFLRKRYKDPLTGKDDWKPVIYGQAHVRPLGFFGQPLSAMGGGVGVASAVMGGASSGMYAIAAPVTTDANGLPVAGSDSPGGSTGSSGSSAFGSSSGSDSGFGSSSSGSSSAFGSGSSGSGSGYGSSSGPGSNAGNGLSGQQSPGSPTGGSSAFGGSSSGLGASSGSGTSATTFGGGGPIVGMTLTVNKPSLIDYKLQTRYNKWEFNYDPMEDQMMAAASMFGGSATDSTGNGTGTNATQFGGSTGTTGNNGFGFGGTTNPTGGSNNPAGPGSGSGSNGSGSSNPNSPNSPQ